MATKNSDGVRAVGALIAVGVVVLLLIWPYLVGVALAQGMGADEESFAARFVGAMFEAAYVAAIVPIAIAVRRKQKIKALLAIRDLSAENLRARIREEGGHINLLEAVRLQVTSAPSGEADDRIPARERLLMELKGVHLVEPRVHQRGFAAFPTYIRPGTLLVSDRAIRHLSSQGKVEWRFDKIYEQFEGAAGMVTWAVSNRQKVSGVGGSTAVVEAVRCLVAWAEDFPAEPTRAAAMVDGLLRAARAQLEDVQTQLTGLTAAPEPEDSEMWSGLTGTALQRPRFVAIAAGAAAFALALAMTSPNSASDSADSDDLRAANEDSGTSFDDPAADDAAVPIVDEAAEESSPKPKPKPKPKPPPTYVVARVVDGDTVVLRNGETVRLVGIDAPETGKCGSVVAAGALATLVKGRKVTLGESDEDRDKYDRMLRYVDVDGVDAGLRLVKRGLAIARYDSRDGYGFHPRERDYIKADRGSANFECAPPAPPKPPKPEPPNTFVDTSSNCAAGYSPCIPAYPPDLDCADTGPVSVTGSDPHGLDADGDGVACGGD